MGKVIPTKDLVKFLRVHEQKAARKYAEDLLEGAFFTQA